jgi:anti-sigma regulatory factor (Ser/Thr protein kinase)
MVGDLEGELDDETLATARLLVSELVANAVEHVPDDGDIEVAVGLTATGVRVEVRDPGPGFEAVATRPAAPDEPGWGLHFVAVLADRWAADRDGAARVWFEIGRRPPARA